MDNFNERKLVTGLTHNMGTQVQICFLIKIIDKYIMRKAMIIYSLLKVTLLQSLFSLVKNDQFAPSFS